MSKIVFEWDERKARSNDLKHGVSFNEAQTVFYDEYARLLYDPDHSQEEERFILLGLSSAFRLLVVCHVSRHSDQSIRIISARKANKRETSIYQNFVR